MFAAAKRPWKNNRKFWFINLTWLFNLWYESWIPGVPIFPEGEGFIFCILVVSQGGNHYLAKSPVFTSNLCSLATWVTRNLRVGCFLFGKREKRGWQLGSTWKRRNLNVSHCPESNRGDVERVCDEVHHVPPSEWRINQLENNIN